MPTINKLLTLKEISDGYMNRLAGVCILIIFNQIAKKKKEIVEKEILLTVATIF